MSPLENEIQVDPPQEPQNVITTVEIKETTPKRRKISVAAVVHATDSIDNNVISAPQAQEIVLAPRNVVQVPERGYTCTDCKSGTVMVDVDTSTSDLGREEGITITRRCVRCSGIKLLVEASTSTTDLEAAVGQRKEMATSTTNLHEEIVLHVTEEAATSTTDFHGFAVESRKRRTASTNAAPSGGELNDVSVYNRQKSLRSSLKAANPPEVTFEAAPSGGEVSACERRKSVRSSSANVVTTDSHVESRKRRSRSSFKQATNEAEPSVGELNDVSVYDRRKSLRSSFKAAISPKVSFEAAPSGGEVTASEKRKSVRNSSANADESALRTSVNVEAAPSGAESASERRKSRSKQRKSTANDTQPPVGGAEATNNESAVVSERQKSLRSSSASQLLIVDAAPSTEELNEVSVSERLRSLRSSSKQRIGDQSYTAPSTTTNMRSEEEAAHESIFTAVDLSTLQQQESNVNKKKAPRKQKQTDTTECQGIRRSARDRKPASIPRDIVISSSTRFVHNVNRLDYYKHENTDKEEIRRFLSPYLRSSAISISKVKTPRKSTKHSISADTTKTNRKTKSARSILPPTPVAEVSATSSVSEFYAPLPKLKRVKESDDLAVAVCISDRENSRVKSGYLEINAGGKKMENITQHQIVYTVFEGEAEVCIDKKRFRAKTHGEFIVGKGVEYSIRNVSKQKKLRLRFVKVYV